MHALYSRLGGHMLWWNRSNQASTQRYKFDCVLYKEHSRRGLVVVCYNGLLITIPSYIHVQSDRNYALLSHRNNETGSFHDVYSAIKHYLFASVMSDIWKALRAIYVSCLMVLRVLSLPKSPCEEYTQDWSTLYLLCRTKCSLSI